MRPRSTTIILAAAIVAALVWVRPPAAPAEAPLRRMAPRLSVTVARHLARDDDAAFRRWCRSAGTHELQAAYGVLDESIDFTSLAAYARTWTAALPYLRRISAGLANEYRCPGYLRDVETRSRMALATSWQARLRRAELRALDLDTQKPRAWKIARKREMVREFEAMGYERGLMVAEEALALELRRAGQFAEEFALLHSVVRRAERIEDRYMSCQYLGVLGYNHLLRGDVDSMFVCYERALQIATECRFPDQSARMHQFIGSHHADQGRLALASEFYAEAQRVCREMGGGWEETRFLLKSMDHFARIGCWDLVERLMVRAPVLLSVETGSAAQGDLRRDFRHDVARLRARMLMHRGRVDEADRLFAALVDSMASRLPGPPHADLARDWASGLLLNGEPERALPVLDRGIVYCDSLHYDTYSAPMRLDRARGLFSLGRYAESRAALEEFDAWERRASGAGDALAVHRDVLAARLSLARADRTAARAALDRALESFERHARSLDRGPQGDLALADFDDLRRANHEWLGGDAAAGYRFELAWRARIAERGRRAAARSTPVLPPPGVIHCVYGSAGESIVRWTATADGVARDSIRCDRASCSRRITEVLRSVTGERAGAGMDRGVAESLRELAQLLLPAAAGDPAIRTLWVSADGPIASLPFEILNVARAGYEPLVAIRDVGYVRGVPPVESAASGPAAIVADPAFSETMRRRHPTLARLTAAGIEVEPVRSVWPAAQTFSGTQASKARVLPALQSAPRIYFASHAVRDPEIPFLAFIPMAATGNGTRGDDYLEIADIRGLNLGGCELIVLSACATSAPYHAERRMGPSLGDAFIDAGAHAVIGTFWVIRDGESEAFLKRVLSGDARRRFDAIAAVSAAKRASWRAGTPVREWAAWSACVRPPRRRVESERAMTGVLQNKPRRPSS